MNNSSSPIIFGEVLFDCFPEGENVLGGAPFNVAWHCQAFGLQPLLISRIGDDLLGGKVITAMRDWGMKTDGLQIDSEHATGRVNVSFHNDEPSYEIIENSAWDFIDNHVLPQLDKDSILYHGSLALRSPVSAQCLEAIKQSTSSSIFVDVNLRTPWWNISDIYHSIQNSQWLKINADELNILSPEKDSCKNKAQHLLTKLHLDLIVVTQGASGAFALTPKDTFQVHPEKTINIVDTVGAGDAFTSVLLLGLLKLWPLDTTIKRAQQFASQVVGLRGATTQHKDFYEPFIKDWSL